MNKRGLYISNSISMLMVLSILMGAFYFQFGLHENPCPLCLLQRVGMIGVVFGLALNTYFGFRKEHFGVVILSAIMGSVFSIRQILLHICPIQGQPTGYGTAVLGMHLYSWAVVVFAMSVIGSVVFLFLAKDENKDSKRKPMTFEKIIFFLSIAIVLINVIATFFECNFGPCCENGPCP
jgi:disulfide bond formation protein DsbB